MNMKYNFEIKEVSKDTALEMVQKYHYSNTLPKLNKHFVGFYLKGKLVGLVTLGWGVTPLHTIKKIFPSLLAKDYFEIGRMCMTEEMPRNSESQMISQLVKWLKINEPEIKVLFTWADGMLGKVGYVYQACSFLYAGNIVTDIYLKDGIKIHPRQTRTLFKTNLEDKRITIRPTKEQMQQLNIQHYKGKQFKYLKFICDNKTKNKLMRESLVDFKQPYPKEKDLMWKVQNDNGKWVETNKPPYKTDMNKKTYNVLNINLNENNSQVEKETNYNNLFDSLL